MKGGGEREESEREDKIEEEKMKYGSLDIRGYIIRQHSFSKLISKQFAM